MCEGSAVAPRTISALPVPGLHPPQGPPTPSCSLQEPRQEIQLTPNNSGSPLSPQHLSPSLFHTRSLSGILLCRGAGGPIPAPQRPLSHIFQHTPNASPADTGCGASRVPALLNFNMEFNGRSIKEAAPPSLKAVYALEERVRQRSMVETLHMLRGRILKTGIPSATDRQG